MNKYPIDTEASEHRLNQLLENLEQEVSDVPQEYNRNPRIQHYDGPFGVIIEDDWDEAGDVITSGSTI
ncbi:MAG: hypothetical protein ACOCVG_04170 [Verrucomicrobiota bacterium]